MPWESMRSRIDAVRAGNDHQYALRFRLDIAAQYSAQISAINWPISIEARDLARHRGSHAGGLLPPTKSARWRHSKLRNVVQDFSRSLNIS